ncbi:MAG TPA: hypothetical protein VLA21_03215 [Candidatus Limnocylindria bacterium]|nr:hypothetical protein [Candidatus Limnocylindria bacterium]
MGKAGYELLALGMRYGFTLLIALLVFRAAMLMLRERRDRARVLRQLPDAGLVGELVTLADGKGYPLAREGVLGSGRGCDIRLPGLKRRELEFAFQPGRGVLLRPIHGRVRAILDGEPLVPRSAWALHGTVLELRGLALRFRLFAGLKVPERKPRTQPDTAEPDAGRAGPAPRSDWDVTWQYAPIPPGGLPAAGWDANGWPDQSGGNPWVTGYVPGVQVQPGPWETEPAAAGYADGTEDLAPAPQSQYLSGQHGNGYPAGSYPQEKAASYGDGSLDSNPMILEDPMYPSDCYPTENNLGEIEDDGSVYPDDAGYGAPPVYADDPTKPERPRYAAFRPDDAMEDPDIYRDDSAQDTPRIARRRRAGGGGR